MAIHLGSASPLISSFLPGNSADHANAPLFGIAPSGVWQAGLLPDRWCALTAPFQPYRPDQKIGLRRYIFCSTFRRVAPPWRYQALCPVEPGLSSKSEGFRDHPAYSDWL